ncbi:BRO-N domain-containing protein [Mitsuokella multacida]|uniref:BRO-N domain-containing protein n=1 Tax=Mitsuokella multacida TaxID=52226 RepID=UPI0026DB885E|nr:Bro-N domain-containing protein [Mitsuokella multacida]
MNELQIFQNPEFGEVRTVSIDGEPWFVGKDVADILGYSNSRDAFARHVDDEDKTSVVIPDTGSNYKSKATLINESGLYSLVLSSKLPTAKKFKRWVTSEVLPAIRKTGSYSVKQAEQDKTREMRAEAMLRNSISKQAKMMMEIAKMSHIKAYQDVMMAKAGNILAGENILPMPQSGRERHSLGWFCEQIGKPKTWANQLGKILKIKGITKCPGENGEFVEDHAKGNHQKQVQNFEWYVDYLLPIVQRGAEKHWLVD